ncbi:MAG: restriction endonuclease subunit S [Rubrivivax sp.]|nr:MAG: restriction endonuclease subunit S [Rubrivivax sp.]
MIMAIDRGNWEMRPLIEVAKLQRGFDLPVQDRSAGSTPVFAANGPIGTHARAMCKGPGVVTGRSGTIGKVHYVEGDYWPLNTSLFVVDFCGNHPKWVYYLLKSFGLERFAQGAGVPTLNRNLVHGELVAVPPLAEQEHIAAVLDKADSLTRKRQDAIRLADDLLRATLLNCLEQPYDALVVEQLLSVKNSAIRTGPFGSQLLHAEFTESGVPVLGIDNVVTNRFRWDERRYISAEKYEQLSRYTVYPGDVMVTIMGTTGRVAVAPDDLPVCISTKHLCTMTVDRTKILPEFLWACLLWDPAVRAQSSRESKGAIMEGLNMGIVKGLLIKVPSIDVQQRFVSVLHKVDALRSKYKIAGDDGTSLNAALTSKLLAGSSQY